MDPLLSCLNESLRATIARQREYDRARVALAAELEQVDWNQREWDLYWQVRSIGLKHEFSMSVHESTLDCTVCTFEGRLSHPSLHERTLRVSVPYDDKGGRLHKKWDAWFLAQNRATRWLTIELIRGGGTDSYEELKKQPDETLH